MEHDAWFFIGVFVFIFLVWAATGGPTHPLSFTGPTLALPGALGGGTYLQLPSSPFKIGGSEVHLPGSSYGGGSNTGGGSYPTVGGVSYGQPSKFREFVSLGHYVSNPGSNDPKNESVEIAVSQSAGIPLSLSGWTLLSEASGKSALIPKGTAVPLSGVINAVQDIVLSPGERAIVISGRSPIGASFRENKCIGYFGSFQTFNPSLPLNCPAPSDELLAHYGPDYIRDPNCIEYVKTLNRCQVVLTPPTTISSACQHFVNTYLNYTGCINAHRNDIDFNGTTWRIYLGRTAPLWRGNYEVVKLLDLKGQTIDAFTY